MRRSLVPLLFASCASLLAQPDARTFDAAAFTYSQPWELRTNVEGASDGTILAAPDQLEMLEASLSPELTGPYMIYLGLRYEKPPRDGRFYGPAVHVRLDQDEYRVYLATGKPFEELPFKAADMTGRSLIVASLSERAALIDYVRFEPMSAEDFAAYERKRLAPHERDVVGINDVNVWMWDYTSRTEWDFKDIIGQHVFAGYNRVYWMANAGALFYNTKVGTPYKRDKREFTPRSGYMIENFKPLESGVKYAHDQGVEILGWYRLNNNFASPSLLEELGDGLNSEFFMTHPEYRCVDEKGRVDYSRYSFAYPEVRAYVRAICVEMVEKGVDGLLLDLLRHPPLAKYEPPLVDGYKAKYGIDPRTVSVANREEYQRWIKYRAEESFTKFVRELREDCRKLGRPVPIGIRCALGPFETNTAWCMDVEELIGQGLVSELCLMNGYLGRADLTFRPDEIATAAAPYFELCKGKQIKFTGGMHGPSLTPAETLTYTRFFHEAGFDGVAIYESDEMINRMAYRPLYQTLKFRQRVEEPWISVSSSTSGQLVPWWPSPDDAAPWWQLNLPEAGNVRSVGLRFGPTGTLPVSAQMQMPNSDGSWATVGEAVPVDATGRVVSIPVNASGRKFRVLFAGPRAHDAELIAATVDHDAGSLQIGEQRDGKVTIASHKEGDTIKPGDVFNVQVAGDPERSNVDFYWDGGHIRAEREAPFTWYTPETLRPGKHTLKVRVPTSPLAPSVDEIQVTVAGKAFEFAPLPEGARLIAQEDFEGLPVGVADPPEGWYWARGYGDTYDLEPPKGHLEITQAGGSQAARLVWTGDGPRMLLNLDLNEPVPAGMVEFDFMLPDGQNARLAGLYEGPELNGAMYLNDNGAMTYNSGKLSHAPFSPPIKTIPGWWHHVKWEWDAGTDKQAIYIDDMTTPLVTDCGMRRSTRKGIDHFAIFFFENAPGEAMIDNVRAAAY